MPTRILCASTTKERCDLLREGLACWFTGLGVTVEPTKYDYKVIATCLDEDTLEQAYCFTAGLVWALDKEPLINGPQGYEDPDSPRYGME